MNCDSEVQMKIIDITQELFSCNVYPGDKQPIWELVMNIEHDMCNLTTFSMCVHNGTHIDAPKHFVAGGKAVHELDLSIFYGKCTVVEAEGVMGAEEMADILKGCSDRLLIKGEFELTEEAAIVLAKSHVRLFGIEGQSIGSMENPIPNHVILLEQEIIPVEGLVLSGVACGEYTLSAFPLNMAESDGSPIRAVLIEE
jgi:arylformamidase